MDLLLNLLILQAFLGAFDTIYHHELTVALPRCAGARRELQIHGARSLLYGVIFAGIAWFAWGGWWTAALITIVAVEIGLTLWDFAVEDETRVLPRSERITHTLLAINGGAAFLLLALQLPDWAALADRPHPVYYGWKSWFLTFAAVGVALSGVRDTLAAWETARLELGMELDVGLPHRRFLISGATGFIGSALCRELLRAGHEITVITRRPVAAAVQFAGRVRALRNPAELSPDEYFDVIVNLAGAPVIGPRWSKVRKQALLGSRLGMTAGLLAFVRRARRRPEVWVQASAVGYYGTRPGALVDEGAPSGTDFAALLCRRWEAVARGIDALGVRRVTLRMGLVFGRSGGALPALLAPFRLGAGSVLGNGAQRVAWIHLEDVLRLIARAISDPGIAGDINAVAPDAPTQTEFANKVGDALRRPVMLRLPASLLWMVLGEMAVLLVEGPRIVSGRLDRIGFEFRFRDVQAALMDLA